MKRILFIMLGMVLGAAVFAQKEALTLDEHNKFIYYQIADMPNLSADILYSRCLAGLKNDFKNKGIKPVLMPASSINFKSALVLYNTSGMAKHESGEMAYTLNVEFKDGKYRYWLSDMMFTPYERNRYNVYARVAGVEIPLEELKAKYDDKTFDTYAAQILSFGKQIGDQLKVYASAIVKKEVQPAKIDTRKW
jgi:hypothetical protein